MFARVGNLVVVVSSWLLVSACDFGIGGRTVVFLVHIHLVGLDN